LRSNGCTVATIACLAWAGGGADVSHGQQKTLGQQEALVDTSLLDGADGALLEAMLADTEQGIGELAVRTRVRQRSASVNQVSLYRRARWTLPSGHQFHVVAERDAGEPDWHDFVALYGRWQLSEAVQVHVGDLRPGFAQGLVFSRGSGRGGTVTPLRRSDSDAIGYRASGENQALRGVSLRLHHRRIVSTLIAASLRRDASLDTAGSVISLPASGRHVSAVEQVGKNQLSGTLLGLRVHHRNGGLQLGATWCRLSADSKIDLRRPESRPEGFEGESQRLASIDVSIGRRRRGGAVVFGEAAVDGRREWGLVAGGRAAGNGVRFDGLARYYSAGFHSFFGGSASSVGMNNELGLALALQGRRGRLFRWRLFHDRYQRPSLSAGGEGVATSSVWGGLLQSQIGRHWHLDTTLQQRRRLRSAGSPHDYSLDVRVDAIRDLAGQGTAVRLRSEWKRVRVQSEGPQAGVNISMSWKKQQGTRHYAFHLSRFLTPSYDARIYEYERDFPGSVSIRALYGDGWRGVAMVRGELGRGFFLALRCRHQRVGGEPRRLDTLTGLQIDYESPG